MNVATRIIDKLDGHQAVANLLGCHITRVYRWTYPVTHGGTGGLVPQKQQLKLLNLRPDKLRPSDFFPKPGDFVAVPKPKRKRRKAA